MVCHQELRHCQHILHLLRRELLSSPVAQYSPCEEVRPIGVRRNLNHPNGVINVVSF